MSSDSPSLAAGSAAMPRSGPPARRATAGAVGVKTALLLMGATCLLAAVAGGLLRAGAAPDSMSTLQTLGQAAVAHAGLMISGFLGTVIAIERAVALKARAAWAAPLASATGGLFALAGQADLAAGLWVAAALIFVGVNVVLVRRQAAAHTGLLLGGALAWLAGNLVGAAGLSPGARLPWWFAFLVLTIAAERLEMARLMRHRALAGPCLAAALGLLVTGAALSGSNPRHGGLLYGSGLIGLAAWLAVFDIARRTVRARGLSRYMALCLLTGYGWLAVAGVAWIGMAWGCPGRDMAMHALGLGFVISMVMGHAPVILPAIARVKILYGSWFYLPFGLLHGSLLLRLFGGFTQPGLRALGASLNGVAMAVFIATLLASAIAWRRRRAAAPRRTGVST